MLNYVIVKLMTIKKIFLNLAKFRVKKVERIIN